MPPIPNLDQARVIVVLFTIDGCSACEDLKPRFQRIAQNYTGFPIVQADANDPQWRHLAERLNVSNVPAMYVMRRPTGLITQVGAVPDAQIQWLLGVAAREAALAR